LGFNRATLLVGTVAASKRARGCEVCVDTRSLVSLDANFLLLDFTRSLNIVSAFGLGAGAALALSDVHTDLLLATRTVKQAVGWTTVSTVGALELVGNGTAGTRTATSRASGSTSTSSTTIATVTTSSTQGNNRVAKGCVEVHMATISTNKGCTSSSTSSSETP
jgi:hypothetical protein